MLTPNPHRCGFTLLELLIAIAAMALVLFYTLGTFTANRNTYVVIENVSEAHQNLLAIGAMVERDIRNAGYMVPPALAACGVDHTGAPDMLFVSDSDAIREIEGPNPLPSEFAGREDRLHADLEAALPAGWPGSLDLADLVIDGQATYDTDGVPGADSDFRKGAGAIFANLSNPNHVFCGIITNVNEASDAITVDLDTAGGTPSGVGQWAVVPANVYWIDNGTLMRNDVVMARNVEDLQLAWFYDLDKDGQLDTGEDFASGKAGENNLDSLTGWNPIGDTGLLREIRFDIVVRTADEDPRGTVKFGRPQDIENRSYASPVATDAFRRRIHTATIRLRNVAT